MKKEIRISTKNMMIWVVQRWKIAVPAMLVLIGFLMFSMTKQEANEYEENTKYLYTMDELRDLMTDKDYESIQRVLAVDDLLKERNDELAKVRELEPTEDNLTKQMELLEEIDKLNNLRSNFIVYFSTIQSRYYWLYTDTDVPVREDFQKPFGISKRVIAFSVIGGVGFVLVIMVLIYLFLGYLHTKEELEINFGYDVYSVSLKDRELLDRICFIIKAEKLQNAENVVVAGDLKWDQEDNKKIKQAIQDKTQALFIEDITENVDCLEQLNEKQILLVERANQSKLRKIQDNDLVIKKAKGNVAGVLFVS